MEGSNWDELAKQAVSDKAAFAPIAQTRSAFIPRMEKAMTVRIPALHPTKSANMSSSCRVHTLQLTMALRGGLHHDLLINCLH